jgi:hypothetical protein
MASDRYTTLVAVLDDPINKLIIERELRRAGGSGKWFPPPTRIKDGKGFLILTPREWATRPSSTPICAKTLSDFDYLAHVWGEGPDSWYASFPEGTEVGPFPSARKARDEAISILNDQGWVLHDPPPWTEEDAKDYPLR